MDKVGVLYINSTTDCQSPVTVDVPSNGEYMVTVLPIRAGVGILDAVVKFSQLITVEYYVFTTSGDVIITTIPIATCPEQS